MATKPKTLLLKITILTGSFSWANDRKSPISIVKPPSPHMAITCLFGSVACAPIACGMALAIEPWLNEPSRRRLPFIFR
ncbi:hypothetical protein D3C71_1439810 [compost metagenome]